MDAWGNESDYTDTLVLANTNRVRCVTLGWEPSPSEGITNYRVYHGRVPGVWTNQVDAGTNLTATIRILPPALSNLVVRVTCNGTGLIYSPDIGRFQVWNYLAATTLTVTNPGTMFWRSVGYGSTVTITNWRQ